MSDEPIIYEKIDNIRDVSKSVPLERSAREAIRARAGEIVEELDRSHPLTRSELQFQGLRVLSDLGYCPCLLGYAMVMVNNAFWREQFAAIPPERRVLLLPHCLRDAENCKGTYTADEFLCAGCGACMLGRLKEEAEALGYRVLAAEGSPAAVRLIMDESFDGILGVACLDSLEKAFRKVSSIGVPHIALPLLREGCVDTLAEVDEIRRTMQLKPRGGPERTRSYLPLFRKTREIFEPNELHRLLENYLETQHDPDRAEPMAAVDAYSTEWLREGGKRLRPFVVLAGYCLARHGSEVLYSDAAPDDLLPDSVKRVAIAIELFHKASLVHDDIADDDPTRYGRPTMHARRGLPQALNTGDYMIGLGYRLVADQAEELGATCALDIQNALARAHLRLCKGQSAEMMWTERGARDMGTVDVLSVYAAKTAPAFGVALHAGLRMAGHPISTEVLRSYCRSLGVAYQIQDDLQEWEPSETDGSYPGRDALAGRATLLQAFALEAASPETREILLTPRAAEESEQEYLARTYDLYRRLGVFDKARELSRRFRKRAVRTIEEIEEPAIADLFFLLLETILGPA